MVCQHRLHFIQSETESAYESEIQTLILFSDGDLYLFHGLANGSSTINYSGQQLIQLTNGNA
jgi:hypothetical protein